MDSTTETEPPDAEPGLRERKRQKTRQLIADTARELFVERGFEAVSVADVARAAEVSEATVYNYFPTKVDLVYQRMEGVGEELIDAVRMRSHSESILDAYRRFILGRGHFLANEDKRVAESHMAISRMISHSPSLLARERLIFERLTDSLAAIIAEDAGADVGDTRPWTIANALIGVGRAMMDFLRQRIDAGFLNGAYLSREMIAEGSRCFSLLERGLGDWSLGRNEREPPPLE